MVLKIRSLITLLLFLLASDGALAACSGTISGGGTGSEHYVDISDGGCEFPVMMINGEYKFSDECKDTHNGFSCRDNGRTPISGATYILKKDAKPICEGAKYAERYKCIRGCRKVTPKYLTVSPYEC